jgi:hypothetical protein
MAAALGCRRVQIRLVVEPSALRAATMATGIRFCKLPRAETKHRARCYGMDGRDALLSRIPNELAC